jgi:hypothetical protein
MDYSPVSKYLNDRERGVLIRMATPQPVRLFPILRAESLNAGHPACHYVLAREAAALLSFSRMLATQTRSPQSTARYVLALMTSCLNESITQT